MGRPFNPLASNHGIFYIKESKTFFSLFNIILINEIHSLIVLEPEVATLQQALSNNFNRIKELVLKVATNNLIIKLHMYICIH